MFVMPLTYKYILEWLPWNVVAVRHMGNSVNQALFLLPSSAPGYKARYKVAILLGVLNSLCHRNYSILSHPGKWLDTIVTSHKTFSERKQAHVGMEP